MKMHPLSFWLVNGSALCVLLSSNPMAAQIVPDATLKVNSVVTQQGNTSLINGGTTAGTNLFHSFKEFSLPTGAEAYFNNGVGIENIFSRVTGPSISNIDGLIRANGTANLFLLNPNGIIFGGNAQLNIGGSFVASTASSLVFADGTVLNAKPATPTTPLLTISVPIGLQYGSNPGSVQVRGSSLQVAPGKTLAVVGGNVSLEGGQLLAPGGRVELGGVAGESTVGLSANGEYLGLSFPQQVPLSDVSLTNGAKVNVLAGSGGSIAVNAMNFNLAGGSSLQAGIDEGMNSVGSVAGDIEVNATGAINLSDASLIFNHVQPNAVGNGGDIRITTRSLLATGGSQVRTTTYAQGNAGSVRITASDTVTFDGVDSNGSPSAARSLVRAGGVGNSGGVTINTGSLFVTNGADLNASVTRQARGTGGGIKINARDTVVFNGGFARSRLEKDGAGRAGDIHINTGSLLLTGIPKDVADDHIGQVVAATFGQGDAGSVIINARNAVTLDGEGSEIWTLVAENRGVGNAGNIIINSGSLSVTGGARLFSSVENLGNAGDITITTGLLSVTNNSAIRSGVYGRGTGRSGDINIFTRSLNLTASTLGTALENTAQGKAGNINIDVQGRVVIDGGGQEKQASIVSFTSGASQDIIGDAGNINIKADSLSLIRGGEISTGVGDTFSTGTTRGNGGNISIQLKDALSLNQSFITSRVFANGIGNAGDINIRAGSVTLYQSVISASTQGQGNAGAVGVRAANTVSLADSDISTAVQPGAIGNAKGISITARSLSLTDGAQLNAITSGQGDAGNIRIDAGDRVSVSGTNTTITPTNLFETIVPSFRSAPDFVDGVSSGIFTSTNSSGVGGNITVNTRHVSVDNGAVVDARTTGSGSGGAIVINTNTFEATSGGQLSAITSGTGTAGSITLQATDTATISGSDPTYPQRLAQFGSQPDIYGKLKVGNIGAASGLTVSSTGSGSAGNLEVTAGSIRLDNRATFSADTSGGGGNIELRSRDLILRHGSSITTNARGSNITGGNITIDTDNLLAVPKENSDISANATGSSGGRVIVNASGIFGTQFRDAPTPLSDITASSELGPQFNGTVQLNTPDIDPNRGLAALPTNVIDPSELIANSCIGRSNRRQGKFIITGNGGLPLMPDDPPVAPYPTYQIPTLQSASVSGSREPEGSRSSSSNSLNSTPPTSKPVVEATGWKYGSRGEVILTALAPTVAPDSSWSKLPTCPASR
jgi:filamentous hemagglutinin family protein